MWHGLLDSSLSASVMQVTVKNGGPVKIEAELAGYQVAGHMICFPPRWFSPPDNQFTSPIIDTPGRKQ